MTHYIHALQIIYLILYLLCPPPQCNGGGILLSSSPNNFQLWCAARRVIYHSKGVWEYIPKSIPSVCTTIFKRIAGLCFYLKSLMLYINGFVLTSSGKRWKVFFFKFRIRFRIIGRNPHKKIIPTNKEAWILIKVKCFTYQWICLDKLYKLTKSLFPISNSFSNYGPKIENYSNEYIHIARCEYWSNSNVLYINGFVSTSSTH